MRDDLYSSYTQFKGWNKSIDGGFQDFTNLLNLAGLNGSLRIIEIGCGAGTYMDWAKKNGHYIEGTELIPEMVEAVRAKGHTVHLVPTPPSKFPSQSFDAIVAIDVLEHLSLDQLRELADLAKAVLKPTGRLIAQFPNGASPFFGRYQYGDYTHPKPISPTSIRQILEPEGLKFEFSFNPRALPSGFLRNAKRRSVYLIRDIIEIFIGYVYFGRRVPLDPNVVVVLSPIEKT